MCVQKKKAKMRATKGTFQNQIAEIRNQHKMVMEMGLSVFLPTNVQRDSDKTGQEKPHGKRFPVHPIVKSFPCAKHFL